MTPDPNRSSSLRSARVLIIGLSSIMRAQATTIPGYGYRLPWVSSAWSSLW